MRSLCLAVLAIGLLAVAAPAQSFPQALGRQAAEADPQQRALVEQFAKLEREWMEALVRKDRAALERFLTPEYALHVSDAPEQEIPRAMWLETSMCCYDLAEFTQRAHKVRMIGDDVAVVSFIHRQKASVKPRSGAPAGAAPRDRSGDFYLVDVWRKVGNEWKVSARYSSPLGAAAWKE